MLGDLNGDGVVTPADALMIHKHLAAPELNGTQQALADEDGDGAVTADDAAAIKDYYLRKQKSFKFAAIGLLPENGAESSDPPYELTFAVEVSAQTYGIHVHRMEYGSRRHRDGLCRRRHADDRRDRCDAVCAVVD